MVDKLNKNIRIDRINHILVSRLRFLGDVILTTPLLRALRSAFPKAHIAYLAEKPYYQVLEHHPDVDEIYALDRHNKREQWRLIRAMRRKNWELSIDLFGNPRSAIVTFLSGARYRIGGSYRGRGQLYTHRIEDDGRPKNAIAFHLRYLQPLQIKAQPGPAFVAVSESENKWAAAYLEQSGYDLSRAVIGIHAGASWPAKRWLPERFASLADRLAEEAKQVIFTMGPGEEALVQSILDKCRTKVARPRILTIRQLAAVLKKLQVYVANDCGPMHLAPAVGTPTVGIFGPGEPEIWFPYDADSGHRLVYHEIDCSRCHQDFCEKLDCMKAISVDEVYEQVIDSLNSRGS